MGEILRRRTLIDGASSNVAMGTLTMEPGQRRMIILPDTTQTLTINLPEVTGYNNFKIWLSNGLDSSILRGDDYSHNTHTVMSMWYINGTFEGLLYRWKSSSSFQTCHLSGISSTYGALYSYGYDKNTGNMYITWANSSAYNTTLAVVFGLWHSEGITTFTYNGTYEYIAWN